MRTIKFRGKRLNGKWKHNKSITQLESGNVRLGGYAVIPETVGQFTGLFDKNGVEIYEGDIIKVDIFSKPYLISFGQSEKWGACFCVQSHNSITFLTKNWSSTSEVIGNIYENPELLQ